MTKSLDKMKKRYSIDIHMDVLTIDEVDTETKITKKYVEEELEKTFFWDDMFPGAIRNLKIKVQKI